MPKLLTLAATGLVGLVLGAGIGVAAADQDGPTRMSEQMPAELAEKCDEMHADMGSMMGSMGSMESMSSMMGGMGAGMSDHEAHHPGTEG